MMSQYFDHCGSIGENPPVSCIPEGVSPPVGFFAVLAVRGGLRSSSSAKVFGESSDNLKFNGGSVYWGKVTIWL
jgi:hypothetical protein